MRRQSPGWRPSGRNAATRWGTTTAITLNARLLLGVAQRCAGHPELAESHIDAARTGLTRGFGEDSSDALACRLSQALNWLALKRYSGSA